MRIYSEFDINTFGAWAGAIDTKKHIIETGNAENFNAMMDDIFPDGCTDTEMNDLLWFDSSTVYDWLGLDEDGNEIDDLENYYAFDKFCQEHDCRSCPLFHVGSDCEQLFIEAKEGKKL